MIRFDRERFDDRLGAWAMAALVGSAVGTVVHSVVTGRAYFFNSYPVGLADWLILVGSRGVFVWVSRTALARAGWGVALVAASAAAATAPIQARRLQAGGFEGAAIMLAGGLVFAGLPPRHARRSTFGIAAIVLVSVIVVRIVALRMIDDLLSTTVIRVQ